MTPPCYSFPASELPLRACLDVRGRRRKFDPPARELDLAGCELFRMLQYSCEIRDRHLPDSPVLCYPVERLFRRCKDRKSTFVVETTAWEHRGPDPPQRAPAEPAPAEPVKPFQWSSSFADADEAPR